MTTEEIDKKIGMPDIDQEWARLKREVIDAPQLTRQPRRRWSRAAVIALVCALGGLVLAATLGMRKEKSAPVETTVSTEADAAPASISTAVEVLAEEAAAGHFDEGAQAWVFDDVELQTIAHCLEQTYGVEAVFANEEARHVRLYVTLPREKGLEGIVELLNSLHHVQLRLEEGQLIIQ